MLRKKLLARLGLLVVGFVAGAVVSITLLQGVLVDLNHIKADAEAIIDGVQDLGTALTAAEAEAAAARAGPGAEPALLAARRQEFSRVLERLGRHEVMSAPGGEGAPALQRIREQAPVFLVDASRQTASGAPGPEVLAEATALRAAIAELGAIAHRHVAAQQSAVSERLRMLIIGLTIAALVITNIAIFVLVRTAHMILRPIGALIEGSRELASERFDHRIRIVQRDEFDELARAYNALADQLAANEAKKVKALQQLAVTLNHELNNVINVIELQLRLLDRRSGGDPVLASHLNGIHGNLERMAAVIASLRNVRRVVLTDYLPGEAMLDLPKCIEPDEHPVVGAAGPAGASRP